MMPIAINGKVISGLGVATVLIGMQKDLLRPYFPQIDTCQIGTINVDLSMPLQVRLPDIVTPPVRWNPSQPGGERFGITHVEIELSGEARQEAWLYTPEHSPHRFNSYLAEIIAEPLVGIHVGRSCTIHIDRFVPIIII
jgi:CTP-dependent riboflavin kinase